jgi:hypothetical protein
MPSIKIELIRRFADPGREAVCSDDPEIPFLKGSARRSIPS